MTHLWIFSFWTFCILVFEQMVFLLDIYFAARVPFGVTCLQFVVAPLTRSPAFRHPGTYYHPNDGILNFKPKIP